MELEQIQMDPAVAQAAYADYAKAVKINHDAEDQAIAQGYRALAEGKSLIQLSKVLAAGGTTTIEVRQSWSREMITMTVPSLAVCRADAKIAWTQGVDRDGGCEITADKRRNELHTRNRADRMLFADGTFDAGRTGPPVRAIVPNIPPRLRPKRGLQLYTILWEATWAPDPTAPEDPALLRRLGGDLYIVLGTWDLTPLEQAVLSGRTA
jgi:hypothetical protein